MKEERSLVMIDITFYLLAFFAVLGGIVMLLAANTLYSAMGLLITVLSVAGLFALLSASFMFMVQIIVYAGAIMTMFLFILMFLNIKEEDIPKEPKKGIFITLGVVLMIPINLLVIDAIGTLPNKDMTLLESDFGTIKALGMELYTRWLLPFELISILLLVALIGAVVLVKKANKKQGVEK